LEHIPHPKNTLNEVHRILKPGGVTCIIVPNIKNPNTETDDFPNPFHLSHFSEETLNRMMATCGFTSMKALINPAFPFSHQGTARQLASRYGRPLIRIIRRLLSTPAGKSFLNKGVIPQGGLTVLATKEK
jgi:ubiquinone/menaquinone biosynthesis C-methylase UbiE